jgi:hypothetical protein
VLNAVTISVVFVTLDVAVFLDVSCTAENGPARLPLSFTYTSLTLRIVPSSLTARKDI